MFEFWVENLVLHQKYVSEKEYDNIKRKLFNNNSLGDFQEIPKLNLLYFRASFREKLLQNSSIHSSVM